jgi:hypothetical protein
VQIGSRFLFKKEIVMSENPIIEEDHSPIGASSCERWWNCPGSVSLIAALPQVNDANIYSATGTVAHMLGEKILNYIIKGRTTPELFNGFLQDEIGRTYVQDGFEVEVTEKMTDNVSDYVTLVILLVRGNRIRWSQVSPEIRFALTHIDKEAFGTCDVTLHAPFNKIVIVDYKNGTKPVSAVGNKQLQYYGLGAYYRLPEMDRTQIQSIETYICQPNSRDEQTLKKAVITPGELADFEEGLTQAVYRVRQGDQTLQVGDWCTWCKAKAFCPEYAKQLTAKTQLPLLSQVTVEKVSLPSPASLSVDQVKLIMDNADDIKSWCDSVLGFGRGLAERGMMIPGYKWIETKKHRRWINESQVAEAFELELGDLIYTKKVKSPVQLEKVLKKRKDELIPYYEIPPNDKKLVREDDPRPTLGYVPGSEFGVYKEETILS